MQSFYGGPSGKSFLISWIFSTKYGTGNSMQNDISMGWKSPISVGSFVVISYGEPNSKDYEFYLKLDLDVDSKSHNSTLWLKIYDEALNENNGISYRLIMSMAGYTPRIEFIKPVEALDADLMPDIIYNNTNVDKPTVLLRLPQSQVLSMNLPIDVLDADEDPEVIYDEGSRNSSGTIVPGAYGGTINRPVLAFRLPQSLQIQQGTISVIKADLKPSFTLDLTDINKPVLNFSLPISLQLQEGSTTVLDADDDPYFEIDSTDPDKPILNFWLPQSLIMLDPGLTVSGPETAPQVSLDSTNINAPKLNFTLPSAVKFYYGSLLGERAAGTYTITDAAFVNYNIGDYYINAATGFIYKVINVNGTTCTFEYIACILLPLPDVEAISISPYTDTGDINAPNVVRSYTNTEQTTWKLLFLLPKAPKPAVNASFVGSLETGTASASITDADTITFNFRIPTGSKIFAGIEITVDNDSTTIAGARAGDLYFNSETGVIYILQSNNIWKILQGSLKGPVGDALHIVRTYETTIADTFENGRDLIISQYVDSSGNPLDYSSDEIFAVTFKDTAVEEETAYWYFYTADNEWGRVLLTGGITNLLENSYLNSPTENPITNKTYSVDYINKLIGGAKDNNVDKTAFSKLLVLGLLSWGTWADAIAGDDFLES